MTSSTQGSRRGGEAWRRRNKEEGGKDDVPDSYGRDKSPEESECKDDTEIPKEIFLGISDARLSTIRDSDPAEVGRIIRRHG